MKGCPVTEPLKKLKISSAESFLLIFLGLCICICVYKSVWIVVYTRLLVFPSIQFRLYDSDNIMQLSTMLEDTSGSRLGYPTTLLVTEIISSLPLNSILIFFGIRIESIGNETTL